MRAFRYRLAAVLARAEHREQVLQAELVRLQEHLDAAARHLETLRRGRDEARGRLLELQRDEVQLQRVGAVRHDLDRTEVLLGGAAALHQELTKDVESTRQRLLEAARARRMLENHRDQLSQRHRRTELAAETKHLDELGTARSSGRRRAPEMSR